MRSLWMAAALALALGIGASAASISYQVSLTTTPLIGNAEGPFSLDFQLVGDQGSLVAIDTFDFGSGHPTGLANCTGNCTGSLSGAVSLSAASGFFNEFYQTFLPGNLLKFKVTFSGINPPPAGPDSPDGFSFAILDSSLNEIAMLAGNGSFLTVTLDDAVSPSMVTNANDPASGIGSLGTPVVQPVTSGTPEPGSGWLLGLGVLFALAVRYRCGGHGRSVPRA